MATTKKGGQYRNVSGVLVDANGVPIRQEIGLQMSPDDTGGFETEKTLIPDGFPAASVLRGLGILYVEDVPTTVDELTVLEGIGVKYATQIVTALGAL